jgi:hypothetical protein
MDWLIYAINFIGYYANYMGVLWKKLGLAVELAITADIPILSLVITVWSVGGGKLLDKTVHSKYVFWGPLVLTVFYIFNLYAVILLVGHTSSLSIEIIMKASSWYLGPVQGLVTAALGKFFVENI